MQKLLRLAFSSLVAAVLAGCGSQMPNIVPYASDTAQGWSSVAQDADSQACPSASPEHARCYAQVHPVRTLGLHAVGPNAGFYDPSELQSAYKLPSATKGFGQIVAVVDAYDDPNAEADLGVYRSNYGLPLCTTGNGCFKKVGQDGVTCCPPGDQGWGFEISLDVQMVSAICPNCHIVLVEANDNGFANLETAIDSAVNVLHANIVSTSWGNGEFANEIIDDVHFNHPGHVITNSSGDGGFSAGVQYPAASPYVTSVGGTKLVPGTGGRGWKETAWPGSGSGCSAYENKPAWQADAGCAKRMVADVSAIADSVAGYDSYTPRPGWYSFFGTSVSSPVIAGVYALAGNAGTLKYASQSYKRNDLSGLFDTKKGTTGSCTPSYFCTAGEDYDGPTGNGTPSGTTAF